MPSATHLGRVSPSTASPLPLPAAEDRARLDGWKQIAAYLHREVRTVQRWERAEQLPVHRQLHLKLSTVHGLKTELDRWLQSRSPLTREFAIKSIAVRYFANQGSQRRDDYFCYGFVEDLVASLSKLDGIRVFSPSTVARFHGNSLDSQSLGRELKASHVMEGSLRRSGDSLRINVQLVDTLIGHSIWAESFDRTFKQALFIPQQIAAAVASTLHPTACAPPGGSTGFHTKTPGPMTST